MRSAIPPKESGPRRALVSKSPNRGKEFRTQKLPPPFTKAVAILIGLAVLVMQVLFWTHRSIPEDKGWASYALYMTVFAVVGFIGTQIMYDQPPLPTDFVPNGSDEKNKKYISDTILQTAIILFAAMATQLTVQTALSFTIKEQASYFIFAAICEEVLFRVFILSVGFKLVPGAEKLWQAATAAEKIVDRIRLKGQVMVRLSGFLILQSAVFGAIHQNYYGNWPMLLSVILGGLILGIFFIWWRNPTANILAHFLLNIIAVRNLLVLL